MKILMLNHEFPPMGGGAGRATFNIAKELCKVGHEVDILTSAYKGHKQDEVLGGVQIYRVASKKKNIHETDLIGMAMYIFFGIIKFRKLVRQRDYDLTHSFLSIPAGIISLFGKRIYEIPYVVSLRGSDVPGYDPYGFNFIHKFLKPLTKMIWEDSTKIVALSNGLKKMALKVSPTLNFDVIYNGINTKIFRHLKRKKKNDNVKLICVSRLLKRKGIHHLLSALSFLNKSNIELLIVGTGNFEKELKTLTNELNLNNIVSFYGYCDNNKLPRLHTEADIFVLPSLTESFGLVFAEAMSCGLPIVGTTVGGIPEVVSNGQNGFLVEPGDVNALKSVLEKLIKDDKLRERMGKRSIKRIRKSFTWRKIAKEYLKIYEDCKYKTIK